MSTSLLPPSLLAVAVGFALTGAASAATTPEPTAAQLEFFEKAIRPVLSSKCYQCHSEESGKQKGGLLLDSREAMLRGGDSGHAVVPGSAKESLLLKALHWTDKDLRMPPEKQGGQLPAETIAAFERWIAMGAPDPREAKAPVAAKRTDAERARESWAFQPPKEVAPPAVQDAAWPRTPVDRFLLAAQEARGLHPVADAEPSQLLRRVFFDLTGLPPSPDEIVAFTLDHSPAAYEKVVDRLLASPAFGERWGRHWLDVARYAESTGKERNHTFPEAWRYRDYVIDALNADRPYDLFVREQIAGDLLPAASPAERNRQTIATGFLALGTKSLQEKNQEQFRMDLVDEQIDVTSRAVLGLTVACARCHDHKFDPVPQKDYYALAGIFRSTETLYGTAEGAGNNKNRHATPLISLHSAAIPPSASTAAVPAPTPAASAPFRPAPASVDPDLEARIARVALRNPQRAQQLRSTLQAERAAAAAATAAPSGVVRPAAPPPSAVAQRRGKGGGFRAAAAAAAPTPGTAQELCMGVREGRAGDARLLVRGEVAEPGPSVPRGFVTVLEQTAPTLSGTGSGRLELAQWLTAPQNPLTARVAVNRIWLHLFGQGIVRTADNFGASGDAPSHPELLDFLARQFMAQGWSVKQMVRSLVLTRTYALASTGVAKGEEIDPDNRLVWRATQRRLDAEAIRDAMLAASGQLQKTRPLGSVVSHIPEGFVGRDLKPALFTDVEANYRSVYLPIVRDFTPEVLDLFDFAESSLVVAARDATNVPAQALYLMNNSFVRAQAELTAARIVAWASDPAARVRAAYGLTVARPPTAAEQERAARYLKTATTGLAAAPHGSSTAPLEVRAWASFCQALFASAEFRYLR